MLTKEEKILILKSAIDRLTKRLSYFCCLAIYECLRQQIKNFNYSSNVNDKTMYQNIKKYIPEFTKQNAKKYIPEYKYNSISTEWFGRTNNTLIRIAFLQKLINLIENEE